MAATASRVVQDDDNDLDYVPVSSWARQGFVPRVAHAAYDLHPLQYGPLTAQGNYLSQMDNIEWLSSQAVNGAPHLSPETYEEPTNLSTGNYGLMAGTTLGPSAPQWNGAMGELLDQTQYDLYDQATIPATSYQQLQASSQLYPTTADDFLGMSAYANLSRTALGPREGVWAYNPNNVDVNFVYPPDDAPITPPTDQTSEDPNDGLAHKSLPMLSMKQLPPNGMLSNTRMQPPPAITTPVSMNTPPSNHSHASPSHTAATGSIDVISPQSGPAASAPRPEHAPKSLKPERVKRNKTTQVVTLVPRRQGPLSSEARQKADDMRYYGACWRCRRYKKPCNGPGDCDTCRTSGFRVWPSAIGCYRGNMEDFIVGVMPGNAETIMRDLSPAHRKVPIWRVHFGFSPDMRPLPLLRGEEDRFTKLSVKLQATRMAGTGFVELFEILADFQRSRAKPEICLEHACEALSYICDVFHSFVVTDTPVQIVRTDLMAALSKFRSHYSANWRHFLALCLSGRRSAWFPAFLCACINVPLLVVLKDSFTAIPEPVRSSLWPNISFLIEDLRNRLYPMGLDLLSALAKGIKPWKLECWNFVPKINPTTKQPFPGLYERDPDGLRLLGGDVGAFDGFAAIQAWLERNRESMYDGVSFLTTPPFSERNAKMQPIAALAWIFEVAPPGKKMVNSRLVDDPDYIQEVP